MAAPHVAGALALLLSAFPDLSADRQAAALEGGAMDLGAERPGQRLRLRPAGRLAAYRWLALPGLHGVGIPLDGDHDARRNRHVHRYRRGCERLHRRRHTQPRRALRRAGHVELHPAGRLRWQRQRPAHVTTTAGLAPGSYPLTLTGTNGSTSRRAYATLVVPPPPDFTVAAAPASRTVPAGDTTTYTVTVGTLNGFTGNVALSLTGLPGSVGLSAFNPTSVAGAGSSQLTITTPATAPPGTYPLAVTGTSGSLSHTATVMLTVTARDFTLSASPSTVTVSRGQTASYTVSVGSVGGFTGSVSLSVTGLPAGAFATFSTNPVGTPGSSTLRVRTTSSTPRAAFTIRVIGTAGALVHQVPVTLTVR